MKTTLLVLAVAILALCACSKPTPDPVAELNRIVSTPKDGATGKVVSSRTEPTANPSHTAIIEAGIDTEVCRFSVFCKDGTWYYDRPVSLVSEGTAITDIDITSQVSIMAYQFDFRR